VPRALGLEVDAEKDATGAYTEERYTHADGDAHDHPRVPGRRLARS